MTLKEQIKYIKDLQKGVKLATHDGGTYTVWVSEEEIRFLQEVIKSLSRLKGLEK